MSKKRKLKLIAVAFGAIFIVSFIIKEFGYEQENIESELDNQAPKADYSRAIELNPGEADAYYVSGGAKFDLGDYRGAIVDFDKVIEIDPDYKFDPDYAKAYNYQGIAKHNLDHYRDAKAHYDRAIELNPNHAKAYFLRGFAKWFLRDPDGAKADYDRCIKLNSNYEEAYFLRGLAKREFGDLGGAIEDYDRAIEHFERLLHFERRLFLGRGGAKEDYDRAIEQQRFLFLHHGVIADYDWGIEFKPNYVATVAAYYHRGKAKFDLGDYRGAIADYSRMMTVHPQMVTVKFLRPFWGE